MQRVRETDWQWPEEGSERQPGQEFTLAEELQRLETPYLNSKPPMCYPGTTLSKSKLGRAKHLLALQINNIGTHTHGREDESRKPKKREGGFEKTQAMEAEALFMMAGVIGGAPKTVDGYFCGGGTEANDQGLWIGREFLRQYPDPIGRGISVLCTPLTHYSIHKASAKLDLGQSQWNRCALCGHDHLFVPDRRGSGITFVGMDGSGQMDINSIEHVFHLRYEEGFRRFLIVANVGTTALGSIDPVEAIAEFIRRVHRTTLAHCFLHVDAAIGGFTVPFVNPDLKFGFHLPEVMSVAIDGDKMGQLPYPAGIFLCRKNLQSLIARQVIYIRGHEDDTFCGSRSCLAPVLAWYQFRRFGKAGQRDYVKRCLDLRDFLLKLIIEELPAAIYRPLPVSPWINILPVEMMMDPRLRAIPDTYLNEPEILAPYHLRSDFFQQNPKDPQSCPRIVYKLCLMPHLREEHLRQFVADLAAAERDYSAKRAGC